MVNLKSFCSQFILFNLKIWFLVLYIEPKLDILVKKLG